MAARGKHIRMAASARMAAIHAVEVYNRPTAEFRIQNYIMLMIVAWNRLILAMLHVQIGDRYYEKDGRKYIRIDGEKKVWSLDCCLKEVEDLSHETIENLKFFIKLRNRIEHTPVDDLAIEVVLHAECQALLNNFEVNLVRNFGSDLALMRSLSYSLQLTELREGGLGEARRKLNSSATKDILDYIDLLKRSVREDIYNSPEFGIRLIEIPYVANSRTAPAVQFVRDLDAADLMVVEKIQSVTRDVSNVDKHLPSRVVSIVNGQTGANLTTTHHAKLWRAFGVRPPKGFSDPSATNETYCLYDSAFKQHVYTEQWVELVERLISIHKFDVKQIMRLESNSLSPDDY